MAGFRQDSDIFSPVRFEHSLASSTSESSLASITSCDAFKDNHQNLVSSQFSDIDLKERTDVFSPLSDTHNIAGLSRKPSLLSSPTTSSRSISTCSISSKKISPDLKSRSSAQRKSSKEKVVCEEKSDTEKNSKDSVKDCQKPENVQKQDRKGKKPMRPTSLLPLTKKSENSKSNDNKIKNKSAKEAAPSKRVKDSSPSFEKESLKENSSSADENLNIGGKKNSSEEVHLKKEVVSKAHMKSKAPKQLEKKISNPLKNAEDQVVERMIEDCISFESDKIRQILYAQQVSFYRQFNEIKTNMERHHLETTDRLCKAIEELAHLHLTLRENILK